MGHSVIRKALLSTILCIFISPLLSLAQDISYTPLEKVVPSSMLPDSLHVQDANNNLDLFKHQDSYYFAFRTAPSHFASVKTEVHLLSSTDLKSWTHEATYFHESDIREPRFASVGDTVLFYYFRGGTSTFKFEPQEIFCSFKTSNSEWSEPINIGLDGYVPWRFRKLNGMLYLSAYYGVDLYKSGHQGDLRLFTSKDGLHWQPLSDSAQISRSGAEEGEFIFDDEGNLWGTIRLEGEGGMIVYAPADDLAHWQIKYTKYKYDSALLFKHKGEIYLVSRRNLDGEMAKAPKWWPYSLRHKYNLLRYSLTKKVTALFHLNQETVELEHVLDFPSTGDTAFPGIVHVDGDTWYLLNYSNDIEGPEKVWISGQLGKTYIYGTYLRIGE